ETAAIEDAGRVESAFQAAMNFHQRRGQRGEYAGAAVVTEAGAEDRGMAAGLLRTDAHGLCVGVGDPPALGAAPFHQLCTGQLHRLGDRGQRETPERGLRRDTREKWIGLLAQAGPETFCFHRIDYFAAE